MKKNYLIFAIASGFLLMAGFVSAQVDCSKLENTVICYGLGGLPLPSLNNQGGSPSDQSGTANCPPGDCSCRKDFSNVDSGTAVNNNNPVSVSGFSGGFLGRASVPSVNNSVAPASVVPVSFGFARGVRGLLGFVTNFGGVGGGFGIRTTSWFRPRCPSGYRGTPPNCQICPMDAGTGLPRCDACPFLGAGQLENCKVCIPVVSDEKIVNTREEFLNAVRDGYFCTAFCKDVNGVPRGCLLGQNPDGWLCKKLDLNKVNCPQGVQRG